MSIKKFWRETYLQPRLALIAAAASLVAHIASYFGLGMRGEFAWLAVLHLAVMGLGFVLFVRICVHHWLALRSRGAEMPPLHLPRLLIAGTVVAFAMMVILMVTMVSLYGDGSLDIRDGQSVWVVEGVAQPMEPRVASLYAARELRLFSSAWTFFALIVALTSHRITQRNRAYRSASRADQARLRRLPNEELKPTATPSSLVE